MFVTQFGATRFGRAICFGYTFYVVVLYGTAILFRASLGQVQKEASYSYNDFSFNVVSKYKSDVCEETYYPELCVKISLSLFKYYITFKYFRNHYSILTDL